MSFPRREGEDLELWYARLMIATAFGDLKDAWQRCVFWRAEVRRLRRLRKRQQRGDAE